MDKIEKQMAANLLRQAADEFSNHGCNDFDMPNTPENYAFALKAMGKVLERDEQDLPISRDGKTLFLLDHVMMEYLAERLDEEATNE